jgi:lambda repressor-like predicted transcriptional regulator
MFGRDFTESRGIPASVVRTAAEGRDMRTAITKADAGQGDGSAASDSVTMEELKAFAELLRVYLNCGEEDQRGIASMASIATDPNATEDEIEAALETLREGLFPTEALDLEIDREPDEEGVRNQMDLEEQTFASRLDRCMKSKRMSQVELAAAIGVGQPAISMMLSRNCRPQRRTVEKIARALDVPPDELWPGFGASDNVRAAESTHCQPSAVLSPSAGHFRGS